MDGFRFFLLPFLEVNTLPNQLIYCKYCERTDFFWRCCGKKHNLISRNGLATYKTSDFTLMLAAAFSYRIISMVDRSLGQASMNLKPKATNSV